MDESIKTNSIGPSSVINDYQTSVRILKETLDHIHSNITDYLEYSNKKYNASDLATCQQILEICTDGLREYKEKNSNDWHKSAWILQQTIYWCQEIILNHKGYQQHDSSVLELYYQLMLISNQGLVEATHINLPPIMNESAIGDDQIVNESAIGDDQIVNESAIGDDQIVNESVIGDDQIVNESAIGDDNESMIGDDNESMIGDDNEYVIGADNESPIDEWKAGWENGWENGWKSAMKLVRNYTTSRRTAPIPPSCTNCGIYCNLKKCGGSCKGMVRYCSTICQKDHWKQTHKYSCVCLNN